MTLIRLIEILHKNRIMSARYIYEQWEVNGVNNTALLK